MGYNLQGLVRKNAINSINQFEKMGYISESMSNFSTRAYKAVRFEEVMHENGYASHTVRTNHAEGSYQTTKNPLDVAIKGPGFIPIVSKSGEIFYTRDGSFTVDREGTMITTAGDIVGNGITIPANYEKLEIKPDGRVFTYNTLPSDGDYRGTIPVVSFVNPEGLEEVGGNKFAKTQDSGDALLVTDHSRITQYNVERSNVDIFESVNDVMRTNASLLASTSLLGVIDKMYEKAININQ